MDSKKRHFAGVVVDKKEVARILEEISILLEMQGENPFRIKAYRNGAHAILGLDADLKALVKTNKLEEIEGIGEGLAEKITTLVKTGRLPFYEKLKRSAPKGALELMQVHGLGAKKSKILHDKLKITSISALKKACLQGKLAKLKGFGKKTEQNILDALTHKESYAKRHLWWEAMEIAQEILKKLKALKGVKKAEVAGSLRRKMETVGDLDFLVASASPKPIMDWFTKQSSVVRILAKGETKSSVKLQSGMQADIRIVPEKQFAYALCYLTGSKEHNIKLREEALKKGLTLSEWGLVQEKTKKKSPLANKQKVTEADIYKALGFSYIPPELRENQGELASAKKHQIPTLIEEEDIKGTFHNHTTASDGRNTLHEMVQEAERLGWDYIGIADHSKSSFQANGQNEEELHTQVLQIKKINSAKKFRTYVFSGVECDILRNGTLDFSNEILKTLDYVVISIHSAFSQDEKTMTKRLIKAIENPYTTMIGHVTGRLLLQREPYRVHLPKIIDACIANKKIMELNANPLRLDMDWRYWHAAKDKGLLCCINTDAHSKEQLSFFRAGVNIARKGWLEKKSVINTLSLKEMQKFLAKMRK